MADEQDVIELTELVDDVSETQDEGEEETIVTLGEEAAPASLETDTELVKHLRTVARDQAKELQELRRTVQPPKVELGAKPDLWEDCDGDVDRYDAAKAEWDSRKAEVEKANESANESVRIATERRQAKYENFETGKAALKVSDFESAQTVIEGALSLPAQNAIIEIADNPAAFVYAIAKYPDKLAELAKIDDPIALLKAVVKLEGSMKVETRRKVIMPEEIERGNASVSAGGDKELVRLEKEADRTGNRTALIAYKRRISKTK
jgi:hypothetical protein